ncbi:ABC transporter permease [Staphylococcus massiliensis]|uniref:ABC transporter permease n=1 Tax=Staphylococcus massiliensis TaxID=555791 RepID=UPI001EDE34B5|nr:ABC transporter permease [Staphylococcus massiliensis]MCG3413286.1 ABC transporter permease [Staphylococcus massiliensis]
MKWYGKLYVSLVLLCLYVPIVVMMVYSFNSAGSMTGFKGFTWSHYESLFQNKRMLQIVLNTIAVSLLSSSIATVIGVLGAIGIYHIRNQLMKRSILSMNQVLLVSSDVVIGASFLVLFTVIGNLTGLHLGFWTVLISHIAFSIPIVVIIVLPMLYRINQSEFLASEDLGASRTETYRYIVLPQIYPGVLSGFLMALTYSLDDFTVSFFVTGNGFSVLSVEIYAMARRGISLEINALSTIIFVIIMVMLFGYHILKGLLKKRSLTLNEKGVTR